MTGFRTASDRGRIAEDAVAARFAQAGYRILARNYAVHAMGELDLVVQLGTCLSVVEVKARYRAQAFGGAAAALTPAKMKRIRKATLHFQQNHQYMNNELRLLAALVELDSTGAVVSIQIVPIEWR
ncbi:MAG: YraN family protein [Clostridiaceae bacterium]|nr:YraN family protein [Clostridiaceae bacterium]